MWNIEWGAFSIMWYLQFNTIIILNGKIGQKNTKIDGFLEKKTHSNNKCNKNNPGIPTYFPGNGN